MTAACLCLPKSKFYAQLCPLVQITSLCICFFHKLEVHTIKLTQEDLDNGMSSFS